MGGSELKGIREGRKIFIIKSMAHCQGRRGGKERGEEMQPKENVYMCLSLPHTFSLFFSVFFSRSSTATTADHLSTYALPSLALPFHSLHPPFISAPLA